MASTPAVINVSILKRPTTSPAWLRRNQVNDLGLQHYKFAALFWCAVWLDHCSSITLTLTLRKRYYGYSHHWIIMDL